MAVVDEDGSLLMQVWVLAGRGCHSSCTCHMCEMQYVLLLMQLRVTERGVGCAQRRWPCNAKWLCLWAAFLPHSRPAALSAKATLGADCDPCLPV